jgi:tRNA(adenine34) deaminase
VTSQRGPVPDERYAAWMGLALDLAADAARDGDVPVGCVVVSPSGEVVGMGRNRREVDRDPTAHAEVVALRAAARALGTWRLEDCTLVVTLEPCPMCAGALVLARVGRLVLGAWDPKLGATGSVWDIVRDRRANHRVEVVGGVREAECSQVLLDFFATHREAGAEAR